MGLEPDAKGADVKRRYMRLSLLIHPDKCSHPQAQHAFQAVSKASKLLQACPNPPDVIHIRSVPCLRPLSSAILAHTGKLHRQL